MMKLVAIFFLPLVLLMSCAKSRNELSDEGLLRQPYKVGDILVFQSDSSEVDTIEVDKLTRVENADDPLDPFPNLNQTLFVEARKYNRGGSSILTLTTTRSGTYFRFNYRPDRSKVYPGIVQSLKGLDSLIINDTSGICTDCFRIPAIENFDNMKNRPFDLSGITWSQSLGYFMFEFKDGSTWTLTSFLRDKEDLLSKK
ncbi:hypothetical protein [Ekhidna sp.]|jgi:hypothetical protein|uniref:hypothetical protein n=1 Tax=Ekhidna sp. TaxID=2608089 RepID=UPI0032EC2586